MADPARARATYQDILDAPPNMVAELIDGVLYTHPRPALRHARGASRLTSWLDRHFDDDGGDPGGWVILAEPELHLGGDVVVPDVAGWRVERAPALATDAFAAIVPDWIAEGLSPSTAAFDRGAKMDVYAREGLAYLWLFDPTVRTLEVYRLEQRKWVRLGAWSGDATVRAEPFDAVELSLTRLWTRR